MAMVRKIEAVWCIESPDLRYEVGSKGVTEINYSTSHYQVMMENGKAHILPFLSFAALLGEEFDDPDEQTFEEKLSKAMLEMLPEDEEVTA